LDYWRVIFALYFFLKAIKRAPAFLEARLNLSMIYAQRGEFQKAMAQLRRILEIDPDHAAAKELLQSLEKK
jgi:tetratricopeptide (TPR) repeat protein